MPRLVSRRLQLDQGLVPPPSWSLSPLLRPHIYGRSESLKCPGPDGDLREDRKIHGKFWFVSHLARCGHRRGGAQLGDDAPLPSEIVGRHARGPPRYAVAVQRQSAYAPRSLSPRPPASSPHLRAAALGVGDRQKTHPTYIRVQKSLTHGGTSRGELFPLNRNRVRIDHAGLRSEPVRRS
jgi:hypothetical protein